MIKAFFIDVDDTLLDFPKCSKEAIFAAFRTYKIEPKNEYCDTFHRINNAMWRQIEAGELSRTEHLRIRWQTILDELGIPLDGLEFEDIYQGEFRKTAHKIDGAEEALCYLSEKYTLYVASNAREATQVARLTAAGLYGYFEKLFTSQKIGIQKPSTKFFERCIAQTPYGRDEIIMLGDSMNADIIGAASAGIKTVWFNRKEKINNSGVMPDYEIKTLSDIKKIF